MKPHTVTAWALGATGAWILGGALAVAWSYPLDGAARTGIRRLIGYANAQATKGAAKLPPGALLGIDDIQLSLAGRNETWDLTGTAKDPALQKALDGLFAPRDPSYAVAVVDLSDPEHPAWAGVREDRSQLPGSVGKIGCMVALFDGLRRAFPDPSVRLKVLQERVVVAEDWAVGDPHETPHFDPESGRNRFSVIAVGDRFSLAEWVDHMISASANSAGSTIWKEAMLLRRYGADYPPSLDEEHRFFRETPKAELTRLSLAVINEPLTAAGIDLAGFQQGTFWTKAGQRKVPGVASFATPRELARILLRLEQGRLVDAWSSLEMKRYLYMTKRRYRYVYAPELAKAAVYFKSGSFYRCVPEEGFRCGKYKGNAENIMNSVAIVESPARPEPGQRRYLVALMSNVLRVNSAWDHSRLAAAIDATVRTRRTAKVDEAGSEVEVREAGKGD